MVKRKKVETKKIGLEIGLILSRYLLKSDDLHFGYWPQDLDLDILNLPIAQKNHSELVLSNLPLESGSVLDVGCGSGRLGRQLLDRGFGVDGVIPSAYLAEQVREAFDGSSEVFECKYENLTTNKRYDMILFSESFQYIDIQAGTAKTLELLKDGGYVLIYDFFQKEAGGKSPIKGGHKWSEFSRCIDGSPLTLVKDIDATKEISLTFDLIEDAMQEVGLPVRDLVAGAFCESHPILSRILGWKLKKKIEKVNRKYFSGRMTGESFRLHKTYRLLVYQYQTSAHPEPVAGA